LGGQREPVEDGRQLNSELVSKV